MLRSQQFVMLDTSLPSHILLLVLPPHSLLDTLIQESMLLHQPPSPPSVSLGTTYPLVDHNLLVLNVEYPGFQPKPIMLLLVVPTGLSLPALQDTP